MKMKTFELVLSYYDSPTILNNWLYRLINFSDFKKFEKYGRIIIADSGTPRESLDKSLEVAKSLLNSTSFKWVYLRSETEHLRNVVPFEFPARMMNHAFNNVVLDYSDSEVIIISNVGVIFSPDYFNGHIVEHLKNDRAVVLPSRYDLFSDTYHDIGYMEPWSEVIKGNVQPSGGWPDMSVRRKWLVEIGAWDEWYQFIAPIDMDLGSRLTGKLDNGYPSELLFRDPCSRFYSPNKSSYNNLGLDFVQPSNLTFISLTCNTYKGHITSEKRKKSYDYGEEYYIKNWGKIKRNEDRIPTKFEIIASS
jgi:hypothetical protein